MRKTRGKFSRTGLIGRFLVSFTTFFMSLDTFFTNEGAVHLNGGAV